MLGLQQAGLEYDARYLELEGLTDVIVSLESFYLNIDAELDKIDVTTAEVKYAKDYFNSIGKQVGFESYGLGDKIEGSGWELDILSFESSNMFTKIWEAIKKAVVAMRVAFKKLWIKIFDHSPALAKRAAAIRGKADMVDRKNPKEESFDFGGFGSIHIGGEAPKLSDMDKAFKALEDYSGSVFGKSASGAKKVLDSYGKKLNKLKTPEIKKDTKEGAVESNTKETNKFGKEMKEFLKAAAELKYDALTEKPKKDASYTTDESTGVTTQTVALFGDVVFYQTRMKSEALNLAQQEMDTGDTEAVLKTMKTLPKVIRDGRASLTDDKPGKGDVPTLTPKAISKYCDSIETMMKRVSDFNKEFEVRDAGKESLEKTIEQVLKRNESKRDKLNKDYVKIIAASAESMRVVANLVDQPAGELAKYLVNTSNILMNWFDKSLAQYSGKSED